MDPTFYADAEQVIKPRRMLEDGDFFDKFKIIRLLGRGGMGEVYLAEHLFLKHLSALKVLKNNGDDPVFIKRFIREAKLANRIQHPGLIGVFDIGHDIKTDYLFIAMEYVDGLDVGNILKERHFSESEILGIALEVIAPLKVLEQENIVHRDIKPSNIMITSDGRVKLADLGIAKVEKSSEYGDFTLTQENSVFGTPEYSSPEQCQAAHSVDTRSDIYSLGATMYHLAARKPPFAGDTPMAVILSVMQQEPAPLQSIDSNISSGFAELIHDMLQKDPARRPQSMEELEARLYSVYDHSGKIRRLKKSTGDFFVKKKKLLRRIADLVIVAGLVYWGISFITTEKFRSVLEAALAMSGKNTYAAAGNSGTASPHAEAKLSPDGKKLLHFDEGWLLSDYAIPEGVELVNDRAFYGLNNLEKLTVPASLAALTETDMNAEVIQKNCKQLREFVVSPDNQVYQSVNGVLFSKDGRTLAAYPPGKTDAVYRIPDGVVRISPWAFANSVYLQEVIFPNGVLKVSDNAFWNSVVKRVRLPESLAQIGVFAFFSCRNLAQLELPAHLAVIDDNAFAECTALTSLTVPAGVLKIGNSAFSGCYRLASVDIKGRPHLGHSVFAGCPAEPEAQSVSGVQESGDVLETAAPEVQGVGLDVDNLAMRLKKSMEMLERLKQENPASVQEKRWHADRMDFLSRQIDVLKNMQKNGKAGGSAVIPDMDIEATGSGLRSLLLAGADPDCADLRGVTALHRAAMRNNGEDIRNLLLAGADVNCIDNMGQTPLIWAARFGSADAKRVLLGTADAGVVDYSGKNAADYRRQGEFVRAVLAGNIRKIKTFSRKKINPDMALPDGKTPLQYACYTLNVPMVRALLDCGAGVDLAGGGYSPLQMSFIVYRPESAKVTETESGFINSHRTEKGLNSHLAIFKMLLARGADPLVAPAGGKGYKSLLHCMAEEPFDDEIQKRFVPEYIRALEGNSKLRDYAGDTELKARLNARRQGSNVENIPSSAGKTVSGVQISSDGRTLLSVDRDDEREMFKIPDGVEFIAPSAFAHAGNIRMIIVPKGVKVIGEKAFYNCTSLQVIYLPEGVREMGDGAFSGCRVLKKITVPEGVKMGTQCFANCSSLTSAVLPQDLTALPERTFFRCTGLESVKISSGVSDIGDEAFAYCRDLRSVNIPGRVKRIGRRAFAFSGLEAVAIPASVVSVDYYAFGGCRELGNIILRGKPRVDASAFSGTPGWKRLKSRYPGIFSGQ